MLERITDYLVGRVSLSGYFDELFPFVELIERDNIKFPAIYKGNGEYGAVNDFDNYNGMAYFRMNGKQRLTDISDNSSFDMCDKKLEVVYPMRIVAVVPKSKLSKDDAFTDDRVSRTLIELLLQDGGDLKSQLKASSLSIFPEMVTFDNYQVLAEEYQNLPKMKDVNFNFSYHAIDFTVTINIKQSCLTAECEEVYYG